LGKRRSHGLPIPESTGINDLKISTGEPSELMKLVIVPSRVRDATHIEGAPIIGEDHPVIPKCHEYGPSLWCKSRERYGSLEPDP
jgi:hypothetical protein